MQSPNSWIGGGVIGLVIGLLIFPLLFGASRPDTSRMRDNAMMGGNIDRHFIEQMIPHHDGAIAMAKVALERSKKPEILSLAKGIIEAQQKEIDDMRNWYENWFGAPVPVVSQGMMGGHGMMRMGGMVGDIDSLTTATNFDLEFINQMIPHHEMAVMMARMLQGSTDRSEMRNLADQIITSQTREIEMMSTWAEEWN